MFRGWTASGRRVRWVIMQDLFKIHSLRADCLQIRALHTVGCVINRRPAVVESRISDTHTHTHIVKETKAQL